MGLDTRILTELNRYNSINKYIFEQEATEPTPVEDALNAPPPPAGTEAPLETPPDASASPDMSAPPEIVPDTDPDVEKMGSSDSPADEGSGTEELDITDLVTSQKNVEQKQEEYFKTMFSQIETLQTKLSEMDGIITKLNDIEAKVEKYRQKTPQEKLELRSLDSGPFNQKLTDFFTDKAPEMEKSGKNEYVITADQVTNFTPNEIKNSFVATEDDENI